MELYIVRHAVAFDRDPDAWPDDGQRPLTPKGTKRWRRAARGLGTLVNNVQVLLSSPLVRAWQTAKILQKDGGWPTATVCEALEPERDPSELVTVLQQYDPGARIAVVGHEPHLSLLASHLLTGDSARLGVQLDKGACVYMTFAGQPQPGQATLHWLLSPKALRALRQ